ncbi:MAG: phosphatidate cytidylyltransferase [Pseudomonadales bacterium]
MLKQRIITALILAPIAIGGVFFLPPVPFAVFVGTVLTVAAWEWANLAGISGAHRYVYAGALALLLFASYWIAPILVLTAGAVWWLVALVLMVNYPSLSSLWSARPVRAVIGLLVFAPAFVGLVQLKLMPDSNWLILLLFLLIWGADIGAYFAGRAFGNRKLAPDVSPGKSWAGLYGGLAGALVIAIGMILYRGQPDLVSASGLLFLLVCGFVVQVSVLGDLVESMFKRQAGLKDSSNLLPGHGGVLDRVDSLLSASPVFALGMMALT